MGILILVVLLTLLISAQCSLFEATLYSSRVATLESATQRGKLKERASRFLQMKRNITVPIAAILILNTIANTAGATFAGMYANQVLGSSLVPVFSVAFTLAILFLAEILPKTLGAVYWQTVWPFIVQPLSLIQTVLSPAVRVTEKFSELFTKGHVVPTITEDEILAMTRLGAKSGEITRQESDMVHNIIALEETVARDILTPRRVIFSLAANTPVAEALQAMGEQGHSRVPIYEEDKEELIGYVKVHDLLTTSLNGESHKPLREVVQPIAFVAETDNCLHLLSTFLKQRRHIAAVTDEYGGLAGLITLEDLVETALGHEIVDESDRVVDLQDSARQKRPQQSDEEA